MLFCCQWFWFLKEAVITLYMITYLVWDANLFFYGWRGSETVPTNGVRKSYRL